MQRLCNDDAEIDLAATSGAVLVKAGAVLTMEECSVTSKYSNGVVIQGGGSYGFILHNQLQHAKGAGVLFADHAEGLVEDNVISCNGLAGVAIVSNANPVVRGNRICHGLDSGVKVSQQGRGCVEGNDIFANRRAGVAILSKAAPLIKYNRIFDGHDSGVLVCGGGRGSVVENHIFANHMAAVAVCPGGASRVTGNTIRDGNGGSLYLSPSSRARISANMIHQHPPRAMQVPEKLLAGLRKHNCIRY